MVGMQKMGDVKFPKPKIGRPMKWSSPEDIWKRAEEYFDETPAELYTITGLALFIGTSKDTIWRYEKNDQFSDVIKKIRTVIENSYEVLLRNKGTAGSIFALKNFGWRDQSYIEQTGEQTVNHNVTIPDALDSLINPVKPKSRHD
jgi:hypothetical protein